MWWKPLSSYENICFFHTQSAVAPPKGVIESQFCFIQSRLWFQINTVKSNIFLRFASRYCVFKMEITQFCRTQTNTTITLNESNFAAVDQKYNAIYSLSSADFHIIVKNAREKERERKICLVQFEHLTNASNLAHNCHSNTMSAFIVRLRKFWVEIWRRKMLRELWGLEYSGIWAISRLNSSGLNRMRRFFHSRS